MAALHAMLLGLLVLCTAPLHAEGPDGAAEARIKAAFLYKFTGYVTWPSGAFDQADAPFVIAVMQADDIAAELDKLTSGRNVNGHNVVVRRLTAGEATTGAQVLFIGSAASARINRALAATRALPVLTITELDESPIQASVINFVVVDEQVRFDVSLPVAERNMLKISSRLLAVARQVVPGGQQ
ncbi:MAG: YfiR family protein [Rhodocyclaceae bacterium]